MMGGLRLNIIIGATAIIVLMIMLSLAQEMNRRWQIEKEVTRLEQEARKLQRDVIEAENLNQYFRTSDFQERLAREKLNYRAPGEVVVLLPEKDFSEVAIPRYEPEEIPLSTPMRWWRTFFVDEIYEI